MKAELVPIERFIADPNNPRSLLDDACRAELMASISKHGIKVPLIVYLVTNHLMIGDGHRRWDTALALGLKEVPAIIFPQKPSEAELLMTQLTINGHRQNLNPVDEYEAFARLAKLQGWKASDLAAQLAVSNAEITRIQAIGKLSPEERQLVREGKISKSAAYALSRMTPVRRATLVRKAAAGEISRDQLNEQARTKEANPRVRTSRISCPVAGSTVSVHTAAGLNLAGLIELLDTLMKECKKARAQGLDISTMVRVLRDRLRTQPAT